MKTIPMRNPDLVGPIRLVTPDSGGGGEWVVVVVAASVVALVGVVAVAWWVGRSRSGAMRDSGFGVLSKALRLDAGAQELVRKLAGGIGAEPVALLVSGCAYRRAALMGTPGMSKRMRARVGELEKRIHPGIGADVGMHLVG